MEDLDKKPLIEIDESPEYEYPDISEHLKTKDRMVRPGEFKSYFWWEGAD